MPKGWTDAELRSLALQRPGDVGLQKSLEAYLGEREGDAPVPPARTKWPTPQTEEVWQAMTQHEHAARAWRWALRNAKGKWGGEQAEALCRRVWGECLPSGLRLSDWRIAWGSVARAMRREA